MDGRIKIVIYHTATHRSALLLDRKSLSAKALLVRLDELSALGLAFLYHACITFCLSFRAATADLLATFSKFGGRFVVGNRRLHDWSTRVLSKAWSLRTVLLKASKFH